MNEIIFLVVFTLSQTGYDFHHDYYQMPTMEACYEAVKNSKVVLANGGDAEAAVVLFCTHGKSISKINER